jgi:hypothetical protein
LQGGPAGHGFDRNELLLRKVCGPNDPTRFMVALVNYMSKSSFTNCLLHLEGEKVFGFTKRLVDCPLNENNDSHRPNCVDFSHPRVIIPADVFNNVKDVCM